MLVCLTGGLGGGKSYSAVADMVKALGKGNPVGSNIELIPEGVDALLPGYDWRSLYKRLELGEGAPHDDPNTWPIGDRRGSGGRRRALIVIDEAAEWLDSLSGKGDDRIERYGSWLRHSDKLGCDVVLIVQHWSLLHRRLRAICHEYRIAIDLTKHIIPGAGVKFPWPLNQYIVVKRLDRDCKTSLSRPEFYVREKAIFRCYDTAFMYGHSAGTTGVQLHPGRVTKERKPDLVLEFALMAYTLSVVFS